MADDTITAIATAHGGGGIGIVKISGKHAIPIAEAIFRPSPRRKNEKYHSQGAPGQGTAEDSHRLCLGHIYDRDKDRVIDEVLMAVMHAPHTYTREDVVEINAHGGPLVLQTILKLVIAGGARLAEPGEFTRRAFLNGRIDLTQAEAVVDLINARTDLSMQAAAAQISGQLQDDVNAVRLATVDLLTRLEAAIDFPEEMDDDSAFGSLAAEVQERIVDPVSRLIGRYDDAHVLRDGLRVAIVGKPNVGKSSLLNRLLENDRAIVTDEAGTTRDVVSETIHLKGIPVTFSDTAGLHHSSHPVEIIGIQKTMEQIEGSDLVLFMVEANDPMGDEDLEIYQRVRHRPHLVVVNKIDLVRGRLLDGLLPPVVTQHDHAAVSAKIGDGMDGLKETILALTGGESALRTRPSIIPNLRHKQLLDKVMAAAGELCRDSNDGAGPELLAVNAGEILQLLEELLGIEVRTDVLEHIFKRFCIGK